MEKCRLKADRMYPRLRVKLDSFSLIHSPHSPLDSTSWMLTVRDIISVSFLVFQLLIEISCGGHCLEIRA